MAKIYLKNTSTKWQSNLIDVQSALILLNALTLDQCKYWFMALENDKSNWISILDSELIANLLKESQTTQIVIENEAIQVPFEIPIGVAVETTYKNTQTESPVEEQPEGMPIPITSGAERRFYPRFDIRLRVIIKSGMNTYLTFTKDVSLGGLSLLNNVPEYIFNSEAEIYITAPDQKNNIMFTCMPVASHLGKSRLMFTKIEETKQKLFSTWLQHFVKPNATKVS